MAVVRGGWSALLLAAPGRVLLAPLAPPDSATFDDLTERERDGLGDLHFLACS